MASRERDKNRGASLRNLEPEEFIIIMDKKHPRYDPKVEKPVDDGLVESINALGVIEPVVCRRDGQKYEVMDGRSRVRATLAVNERRRKSGAPLLMVPYILRSAVDDAAAVSIRNHANIRVQQTPMEQARSVQHDMEVLGKSLDQAATERGKNIATVKQWLRVLD